jgi:chromosome segregation ATPase
VELNKVFELESRIQVLRGQLQDTDRKLALATDRNEALTQQITALGGDLQALKGIRDAQTSEGEMLQHQLMQHQVSIKALELQLNQYSQSDQHMVQ